ncbi:S8 family serine peptidase [Paraflavisolibacter sp. H34]|uniref:S8 family serine peptidase n=1 Tax=Huijunlia imazamoxiresistens TaxID=3127457 RepID=UPI00301A56B7
MKKILLLFWPLLCLAEQLQAQRYLVRFKNKGFSTFTIENPSAYLSPAALERRQRHGIAVDSTDLPVTARYLDSLRTVTGVTVLNVSRWLNQVSIQVPAANATAALAKINSFPFVLAASRIASRLQSGETSAQEVPGSSSPAPSAAQRQQAVTANHFDYGNALNQIRLHNGEFLHNIGLRGQNMTLGVLDVGFRNFDVLKAFDSARTNGQLLGTWDFVAREASVSEDGTHGLYVFSTIAAHVPGTMVGTAPKARYYLFRTEDNASEYPIEEHNWVCGAERLDSSGGQVLSSSLGYRYFSDATLTHPYSDLNGNTTIAAIGADLAAKKGLLVVQSAGNDGAGGANTILTPADADSILVVGAVTPSGAAANFTSQGPTSDGQIKPDVVALGAPAVLWGTANATITGNGTSYSTPIMAGLATCLWQGFPEVNNMKIIQVLRQAGSATANPNNQTGYGIPDIRKALLQLLKETAAATATEVNCKATLSWTSKDVSAMRYEIERKYPGETAFSKIGQVAGTGTEFGSRTYRFEDPLAGPATGEVSYRIRQVVDTAAGSFLADYIDTVAATLPSSCTQKGPETVSLLSNPTTGSFYVQATMDEAIDNFTIRIVNALGQTMLHHKTSKPAGLVNIPLNIPTLPAGKYFVSVYKDKQLLATRELIKL